MSKSVLFLFVEKCCLSIEGPGDEIRIFLFKLICAQRIEQSHVGVALCILNQSNLRVFAAAIRTPLGIRFETLIVCLYEINFCTN